MTEQKEGLAQLGLTPPGGRGTDGPSHGLLLEQNKVMNLTAIKEPCAGGSPSLSGLRHPLG